MANLATEFFFNSDNSHARLSIRKTAQLILVDESSLRDALKQAAGLSNSDTPENLIEYGLEGAGLVAIVKRFAASKRVKEEVRLHNIDLLEKMAIIGAQVFIDRMAGIQEPTAQDISRKYLVGTWKEQRTQGIPARKAFVACVKKYSNTPDEYAIEKNLSKYSNRVYQGLFGTTAKKLRSLPVIDGVKTIARNHIPEATELYAVEAVEAIVSDFFVEAEALGIYLSMTRAIAVACHQVKMALDIPRLGAGKSKATVLYELMAHEKPSITNSNTEIVGNDYVYDF